MELSCSTTACPDLSLPDALDFVRNAGFQSIELFRAQHRSSPELQRGSLQTVRTWIQGSGLTLSGLNIRDLTGRKTDTDVRDLRYNLHQLEWDMHLARALGLRAVNLKGGERTHEALDDLIAGVNQLLDRAPDLMINLGSGKGNRLENLADYETVLRNVGERARVLLDTRDLIAADQDIMAFAESLHPRTGLVHLCDHDGDKPVPFGEGELPIDDLFRLLRDVGYGGTLVVEPERVDRGDSRDAAAVARQFVEDALGS